MYNNKGGIVDRLQGEKLLSLFNLRDNTAFTLIYSEFYNELNYYTNKLYHDTNIDPQDCVQDVFLKLWQTKNTVFNSIVEIKAYLYMSIRNDFKNYLKKNTHNEKYMDIMIKENQRIEVEVVEAEVYNHFNYILGLLPSESAKILKLFFENWSAEEIATELGVNKQTVYNKKHKAIEFLRSKISEDKLLIQILLTFLS